VGRAVLQAPPARAVDGRSAATTGVENQKTPHSAASNRRSGVPPRAEARKLSHQAPPGGGRMGRHVLVVPAEVISGSRILSVTYSDRGAARSKRSVRVLSVWCESARIGVLLAVLEQHLTGACGWGRKRPRARPGRRTRRWQGAAALARPGPSTSRGSRERFRGDTSPSSSLGRLGTGPCGTSRGSDPGPLRRAVGSGSVWVWPCGVAPVVLGGAPAQGNAGPMGGRVTLRVAQANTASWRRLIYGSAFWLRALPCSHSFAGSQ
jgi:hypothetical protein